MGLQIDNRSRLAALKAENDRLLSGIFSGIREVALIDVPAHANVGDSMIALGELDYFRSHDIAVRYLGAGTQADLAWLAEWSRRPGTAVVHHGGGNFGTIWPSEHNFRLDVINTLLRAQIIQMPQSIHFSDEASAAATRAALAAHPRYTLLVRDAQSLASAAALNVKPLLVPDMAFRLPPMRRHKPQADVLVLSRVDHEARGRQLDGIGDAWNVRVTDWVHAHRPERLLNDLLLGIDGRRSMRVAVAGWLGRHRLARGSRILSMGKIVVSNRLHVHSLCLLHGIPHALANSMD